MVYAEFGGQTECIMGNWKIENDLTEIRLDISLQNFKRPLDIFSPQIERRRSKEYLVKILAVK